MGVGRALKEVRRLGDAAAAQALKTWKMKVPELFVKNVRNHPGPDSYALRYA